MLWAELLDELAAPRSTRGPRSKSLMHAQWALSFWQCRIRAPGDVAGAVRAVQEQTKYLYRWEPKPMAATIRRVARQYREAVLSNFHTVDLKPLRAYLAKHEKRGRE
jgi:hypothetical protein